MACSSRRLIRLAFNYSKDCTARHLTQSSVGLHSEGMFCSLNAFVPSAGSSHIFICVCLQAQAVRCINALKYCNIVLLQILIASSGVMMSSQCREASVIHYFECLSLGHLLSRDRRSERSECLSLIALSLWPFPLAPFECLPP